MTRSADVRVRWILDLVDKATRPQLAADRTVRRSLDQTDRAQRKATQTATRAAQTVTRSAQQKAMAAERAARGMNTEARAADHAAKELRNLSAAQTRALSATNATAGAQARLAGAYNRSGAAARRGAADTTRWAAAQRKAAGAAKSTSGGIGAAAGAAGRLGGPVGVGAAAAGIGAGAAVGAFVGFEAQMDRVQATVGATTREIGSLTSQAKQLGADTAFSAKEAADGMYQLSTAGFSAREVMRTIPGTLALASASGTDLASSAALQASAIRGFGLATTDANRVADVLAATVNRSAVEMSDLGETLPYVASTARQTGTSFEQVAAAAGILGNAGIKGSQAGTALRTSMLRLTDPTDKMVGVLERMGISAGELSAIPLPEVIGRMAEGLKKLPTRGEKVGAISAVFGKEAAPAMLNLMSKGRKGIDQLVKSLEHSEGTAKRTARTMRSNVAGAWDEFTGSVETAAITLTTRFGPAMRKGLKGGAKGVNDLVKGLTTGRTSRSRIVREPGGPARREVREASTAQRVGAGIREAGGKILDTAKRIGSGAMEAGKQLLAAFKPAEPFFKNVLGPLLGGIAKGVIGSLVGAFKVLVPIITVLAKGLGWIGKVAAPLKGVFAGLGTVIGFLFSGPILKGVGLLGKLGGAFKYVGFAVNIARIPLRILGALIGGLGRLMGKAASVLRGPATAAFKFMGKAAGAVVGVIRGLAGKYLGAAKFVLGAVGRGLAGAAKVITWPFRTALNGVLGVVRGFGGKFLSAGKFLVGKLGDALKGAGGFLSKAIGGAVGFLGNIGRGIADWINKHTPMGDRVEVSVLGKSVGFRLPALRGGGRVPFLAAGGELLVENGRATTVPGDPQRDGTLMFAKPGAAVLTASGQAMMAAGASLSEALARQVPHFAKGGRVRGLVGGAFAQGMSGEGGILGSIREALGGTTPRRRSSSSSSSEIRPGGGWGGSEGIVMAAIRGLGRATFKRPYNSGKGTSDHWTAIKNAFAADISPGSDSIFAAIARRVGIPARKGSWNVFRNRPRGYRSQLLWHAPDGTHRDHVHYGVRKMRAGGRLPGAGAIATHAKGGNRASTNRAFTRYLASLTDDLDRAVLERVQRLRASIAAEARQASGPARKRLRGALSLVDHELGQRAGRLVAAATRATGRSERRTAAADRAGRRLDPAAPGTGEAALELSRVAEAANQGTLERNRRRLRAARAIARKAGDRGSVRELTSQLLELGESIAESATRQVEIARDSVTAARDRMLAEVQERVDAAAHATGMAEAGIMGLEIGQRLNRTADTPGGMRERASAILAGRIPALEAERAAAAAQGATLAAVGDVGGARTAAERVAQLGNDLATALADAGELIRDAALKGAQDLVDTASHGASMADLGLRNLELTQQLAGTFEQGGAARAEFITATIKPALEAELAALEAQRQEAARQGDDVLARQIAEAIAGQQNEILEASLAALEQVAENTEPRTFGGTLGFAYGGETLTDRLVMNGNGV